MFMHNERDRVSQLWDSSANGPSEPLEGWFDGAALGGFGADRNGEVVPPNHGLGDVVDA